MAYVVVMVSSICAFFLYCRWKRVFPRTPDTFRRDLEFTIDGVLYRYSRKDNYVVIEFTVNKHQARVVESRVLGNISIYVDREKVTRKQKKQILERMIVVRKQLIEFIDRTQNKWKYELEHAVNQVSLKHVDEADEAELTVLLTSASEPERIAAQKRLKTLKSE